MKKIKIIMDSGTEYFGDFNIDNLLSTIHNNMGIMLNKIISLGNDILINPSHISSIEIIEVQEE